jgi:hypothetical protein
MPILGSVRKQSRQEQDSGIRRQFGQSVRPEGSWCIRRSEDGQAGHGSLHSAPGLLQHDARIALIVVLGCAGMMSVGAESPLQVRLAAGEAAGGGRVMGWRVSYHQAGAPSTGSTHCQGEDHSGLAQAGRTAGGPWLPYPSAGHATATRASQVFLVALLCSRRRSCQ